MIFLSKLGWLPQYMDLIQKKSLVSDYIPNFFKRFFLGLALFNSSNFDEGKREMKEALDLLKTSSGFSGQERLIPDFWQEFLKRELDDIVQIKESKKTSRIPELNGYFTEYYKGFRELFSQF